jgi:beta-glucosidase/6-phospho-beta-glucosidase/beta-galactosidase
VTLPGRDGFTWAVGLEDTFVPQPHPRTGRVLDEYALTQHYRRWRADLDLAASLGVTAMRWGVPWHRVERAPGRFDWGFTDRVLQRLSELGIAPILDLVHYGCPVWLQDSFANRDYPERVAAYAAAVADRYRSLAKLYTPLNEPVVNAVFCGENGTWPPNLRGEAGYVRVLLRLCEGMSRTIEAIRDVHPTAAIIQVEATSYLETDQPELRPLVEAGWRRHALPTELVLGWVASNHPCTEHLLSLGAEESQLAWHRSHPQRIDIMGINYYPHLSSAAIHIADRGQPVARRRRGTGTDLLELLRRFSVHFGVPVMITETSDRGPAWRREGWLHESVGAVRDARGSGIPVVGYTWWPLYCLFDWRWRKGRLPADAYICRMGLYDLRRDGRGALRRVPSRLVGPFRRLAAAGPP